MRKFLPLFTGLILLAAAACGGGNSAQTSAQTGFSSSREVSQRVGGSLNLVMGSDSKPGVFASYHLEADLSLPGLNTNGDGIEVAKSSVSADVEGKNIHLVMSDSDGAGREGYIIGDKEYKMVNGSPTEMMGQIALSWAVWPLKVVIPLAGTATFAVPNGNDTLSGRAVEVYAIDSAGYDPATFKQLQDSGMFPYTAAKGTVWIDHETGGLMKADLTYQENIYDSAGKLLGNEAGAIKLEISNIGAVSVTAPK